MSKKCALSFKKDREGFCNTIVNGKLRVKQTARIEKTLAVEDNLQVYNDANIGDSVNTTNITIKNQLIYNQPELISKSGETLSQLKTLSFINTNGVGELEDGCCNGLYKKIIKINDSTFSNYTEQQKITASDGSTSAFFGNSVSINDDGTKAIVGSFYGDDPYENQGKAYIFGLSGGSWVEEAGLTASDGATADSFGISVSISSDGTKAIVGAFGDDSSKGSAYIFGLSGSSWVQQQKLIASDGATSDYFGWSVSINSDGSKAIIGAKWDNDYGIESGSVYIFGVSGGSWVQQQKLNASDGSTRDYFGESVYISSDGTKAIIGADGNDDSGNNSGSAYIFGLSGGSWVQQQKLTASDGATNDSFGYSVSMNTDGSKAIIGAYRASKPNNNQGKAYIFGLSGGSWIEEAGITASDGGTNDVFGSSVSMNSNGSKAIIGAYGDDTFKGSVYIFDLSGGSWVQQQKITASDGGTNDAFGSSVSINSDGSKAIIGANWDDSDTGSSYIFGGTGSGYELTYNTTETLTLTNKGDNATLIYNSDPTAGWVKIV